MPCSNQREAAQVDDSEVGGVAEKAVGWVDSEEDWSADHQEEAAASEGHSADRETRGGEAVA